MTSSLVRMAGINAPGAIKFFQMALEDVQGVIGRSFVPILNMMRDGVRLFGDILATILPDTREMNAAMSFLRGGFNEFRDALKDAFAELGPIIKAGLITGIKVLSSVLAVVAKSIAAVTRGFAAVLRPIQNVLNALGLTGPSGMQSSVGAAARPAQIQGLDQYQQSLQLAAYSLPAGEEGEDIQVTLNTTMGNLIDHIQALPGRLWDYLIQLPGRIWEAISGIGSLITNAVMNGISALTTALTNLPTMIANAIRGILPGSGSFSPSGVLQTVGAATGASGILNAVSNVTGIGSSGSSGGGGSSSAGGASSFGSAAVTVIQEATDPFGIRRAVLGF